MTNNDTVNRNLQLLVKIEKGLHKSRSFFALLGHSGVVLLSRDIDTRAHIKKPPESVSGGLYL